MSDLISRLSDLRSQYSCFTENERSAYHTLSEAIEALQEQKTGKWIENPENCQWECSACGNQLSFEPDITPFESGYYFCPNCGAAMVELIMTGETKK